jgi:hypothetical protein
MTMTMNRKRFDHLTLALAAITWLLALTLLVVAIQWLSGPVGQPL